MKIISRAILFTLLMACSGARAQTSVVIDATVRYQTIHGFGASDAWNTDFVGKYWSTTVKNDIARKLFSKTLDANGNATGIGLSRWRFNIGAGSSEQGTESNIELPERRVECFLNEDGSYNWTKQSGQQWFLNQAKTYGVESLVAFVNSPPRFYTKTGRANSDNINRFGNTNLKDGFYDDYARFLASVLKNFENKGLPFAQISPVNEPQYEWNKDQEGCPWKNTEITMLAKELNKALVDSGLSTKMLLAESASFKDLYEDNGNAEKANQIWKFFSPTRLEYIGNLSNMLYGMAGHSYWTDGDDATIRSVRTNTFNKSVQYGGIELYQSEYNLLSKDYGDYLANSIFLAKMIYADLAIANVSVWDYWTAMERERWSQKNRFYLIRLMPTGGDYASLTNGGSIKVDKNLWTLGNYSLFIRPGFKRIKTTGADNLGGLMCSAFMAPDSSRIVAVYVNWGDAPVPVAQTFRLPDGWSVERIRPYVTDVTNNLTAKEIIPLAASYTMPAKSVVTLVIDTKKNLTSLSTAKAESSFDIFPNPGQGIFQIRMNGGAARKVQFAVYDIAGKNVAEGSFMNSGLFTVDISANPAGIYFLKINNEVKKFTTY